VAFEELKQRQSAAWSAAPFENLEPDIAVMHDDLVRRLAPRPGERWLDVGCGPGAVAMRAARAGAEVTGLDLAPGLIETARRRATDEGLSIGYDIGDVEALPYGDASFDVVSSSVGAIFAPDHRAAASELARVTRPGGRLGLSAWRPEQGIAAMMRIMAEFQPPPPEGAGNPFDWGSEEYVSGLLGDAFELEFVEGDAPQVGESGAEIWRRTRENAGPPKALHESLEPARREELDRRMEGFYEEFRTNGGIYQPRPYLLVLGTRR
jgi:ubiquinone/menaquinone biosynthesis C-methylase UbiE